MPYIISTTIDYIYHFCFQYMLNYPVISSLSERERGEKDEREREERKRRERERGKKRERERGERESGGKHAMN